MLEAIIPRQLFPRELAVQRIATRLSIAGARVYIRLLDEGAPVEGLSGWVGWAQTISNLAIDFFFQFSARSDQVATREGVVFPVRSDFYLEARRESRRSQLDTIVQF